MNWWWKPQSLIATLLAPLAWVFSLIVSLRRYAYEIGLLSSTRLAAPVIIVGNLTVGGNGKTPLVIWLAQFLSEQGLQVGIVSRGYGVKAPHYPYAVATNSPTTEAGDEAVLLARATKCPVVIDPIRVRAGEYLLEHFPCDVIISDDGLQHYALQRDIEIVVTNGRRGFGNQRLLPAGPLREPLSRLKTCDFHIKNGGEGDDVMQLVPQDLINLADSRVSQAPDYFQSLNCHALAGIGDPKQFFLTLEGLGLQFTQMAFPDHHVFSASDLPTDGTILMTEKDAVKCAQFAGDNAWYLPVKAVLPESFEQALLKRLAEIVGH